MTSPPNLRHHYRTCNLCEAMCGLEIALDGDQIVSIKGDKQDPFSQGHICPKATALQDVYEDPDRLKHPVRRTAVGWEKIGWAEAFDEVAQRLHAVQQKHGRDAVAVYLGNPNSHNAGSILYAPTLIRALRTKHRYSATSVDQLPHHFASYFMFGHQLLLPVPDIDRTQFMLILGANPLASNGSIMTAPGVKKRLQAIQKRHGRVVVVDPRRTATAELADQHFFIKPGRDVFLLLGLLHTLFADDLIQHGRWTNFSRGLEDLRQLVSAFTLEKVAPLTGIPAADIRQLAHDFATAESAVCYGRIGTSVQAFGGLCNWLINLLNILTDNLDEPGGAMFTRPAFDVVGISGAMGSRGSHNRWQSRVRQRPEFGGELPVATLAEEMLTPGEGQIRALVT
ncbi:MAG: molybdopterin-dependent oxidoreductase, partial [Anaerolineales bacterium]|nr:molybdopterin-dependent oxidoreductase [Anaerolineales bacterium]